MATKYQARIYVTLRSSVLDPAGTAVESGLKQMGYTEVESVRIGKYIEMQLTATDESQAKQHLDEICDRLLANTVIENYHFELTSDPQPPKEAKSQQNFDDGALRRSA